MTVQKAMRIRADLKKMAAKLTKMLGSVDYALSWNDAEQAADTVRTKRDEKLYALEGMTYAEASQKLFKVIEECEKINTAIEEVNATGHKILFRETCLKSKLAFIEDCLEKERAIEHHSVEKTRRWSEDELTSAYVEEELFRYPIMDERCFGKSLPELRKQLSSEIEDVRDELAAFNASAQVDYCLPEGIL